MRVRRQFALSQQAINSAPSLYDIRQKEKPPCPRPRPRPAGGGEGESGDVASEITVDTSRIFTSGDRRLDTKKTGTSEISPAPVAMPGHQRPHVRPRPWQMLLNCFAPLSLSNGVSRCRGRRVIKRDERMRPWRQSVMKSGGEGEGGVGKNSRKADHLL